MLERIRALEQSVQNKRTETPIETSEAARSPDASDILEQTGEVDSFAVFLEAGFQRLQTKAGPCWVRKTSFDACTHHGKHVFDALRYCDVAGLHNLAGTSFTLSQLRFYDTETNGLGTGAGTLPFLHSVGYFEDDEFCVEQYFIDEYDAEPAVLLALASHFTSDHVVVSFNGKSFDWPLLQNRRILHQLDKFAVQHLDLLHPSRRLFKHQLERVKLSVLEQHILGLTRCDDLPGSDAPMRYFAYMSNRDLSQMEDVFRHNLHDVCSLVTLAIEIADILSGRLALHSAVSQMAIANWFDAWHDIQSARVAYEHAIEAEDADWRTHWVYSLFLKRRHFLDDAVRMWEELALQNDHRIEPLVELAKYYEHRVRDFGRAASAVEEAIRRYEANQAMSTQRIQRFQVGGDLLPHRISRNKSSLESEGSVVESPIVRALHHRLERIGRKRDGHSGRLE